MTIILEYDDLGVVGKKKVDSKQINELTLDSFLLDKVSCVPKADTVYFKHTGYGGGTLTKFFKENGVMTPLADAVVTPK